MRKVLTIALFLFTVVTGYAQDYTEKFLINDAAVTSTNDTLTYGWYPLDGATNVALMYSTSDTSWINGTVEYRFANSTATMTGIALGASDSLSLDTRGTTLTGLSKGKILQGYGLATSLIPGANAIRVTLYKKGGEATNAVKCVIIKF